MAFGIRVPARAATPAPSSPRDATDALIAVLSCPDCEGLGCPSCADDAPKGETPAPAACCPAGESQPCRPCRDAPGFADALTAAVGPLPTDEPTALPAWLLGQAEVYEMVGSAAGLLLAKHIRRLLADVEAVMTPGVHKVTVAEVEARLGAPAVA